MFRPLSQEQIRDIVRIQLDLVGKLLRNHDLKLEVSERAVDWLAAKGYDPQLGARPVKRLIQKEVVNELSKEIISGKINDNDSVLVDIKEGRLVFKKTG